MQSLPISVIICAKNAESTLEDCLTSVRDNNPAEIILVDGLSTDRTLEIARKYTELIYSDEGRGFTYSQQLGAEQATQEYIVYIDADIVVPPETLDVMLAEFQQGEYVSICAQIKPTEVSSYWDRAVQQHIELILARQGGGHLICGILRRDTILTHRFDPRVIGGTDFDLYWRMSRQGYKFGLSSVFVYHHHRADLKNFARQKYRHGREKAYFLRGRGLFNLAVWPPVTTVYMLGFSIIKGKPNLIPYFLLDGIIETVGIVKGFVEIMAGGRHG